MDAILTTHRDKGQKTAIVFIHGFMGDPAKTWGNFAKYLLQDSAVDGWDVFSLGYPSSFWFDLVGFWKADPDIPALATSLKTRLQIDPALRNRTAIALIAHSMGGLAVQRALLDTPDLAKGIDSVILFGTPSGGLKKAAFLAGWKRSAADMEEGKPFITALRGEWDATFGKVRPFQFVTAAGDQDEFVPRSSSLTPFAQNDRQIVPGDHLSIVKPESSGSLSVQLVISVLTRNGRSYSAARAAEHATFRDLVDRLSRSRDENRLDQKGLIELALGLEHLGDQDAAIRLLRTATSDQYDARGTLGGRLKRRWLLLHAEQDGLEALAVYRDAFERAAASGAHADAFYNGINYAFLTLGLQGDVATARNIASRVLGHCGNAAANPLTQAQWLRATEAEAQLILGNAPLALTKYTEAATLTSSPRERDSMYQQAARIAEILNDEPTAKQLPRIFGYEEQS
ncbi:MAG: hypothetical protein JWO56_1721 [Acidobacteria bacterium]|nr:hypothetical protein [Acidobacteriota bacterium]